MSHLQGPSSFWTTWPLKIGPLGCLETSVTNYQSTVRNISEERKFHVQEDALQSNVQGFWFFLLKLIIYLKGWGLIITIIIIIIIILLR
jgi:hypothetical protein